MNRFCLFGYPVKHSISPQLHQMMFNLTDTAGSYDLREVEPKDLEAEFQLARQQYDGINLTIPHKQAVIPMLDEIDPAAKALNSVNTVLFKDGRAIGYNTDIYGIKATFESNQVTLKNKKVLLLGAGGVAKTIAYFCKEAGAQVYVWGRNPEKIGAFAKEQGIEVAGATGDFHIVINATPVGMHPHADAAPIDLAPLVNSEPALTDSSSRLGVSKENSSSRLGVSKEGSPDRLGTSEAAADARPQKLEFVFDTIYNPAQTQLLQQASRLGIKTANGLEMLAVQGIVAHEIWRGDLGLQTEKYQKAITLGLQLIMKSAEKKETSEKSIALCGFMGSGKSTIGAILAKALGYKLVDTDEEIEKREGCTINEIFASKGEPYFREKETELFKELVEEKGLIISTGGGLLEREINQELAKQTNVIWLDVPLDEIMERLKNDDTRPLMRQSRENIERLYNRRREIYKRVSEGW